MTASGSAPAAAALALLLCACGGSPQPDARAPGEAAESPAGRLRLDEGSFGYADTAGRELLALDSLRNPARVRAALCARGESHRVVHARRQRPEPGGDERQSASNFSHLGGEVFRVAEGAAPADGTCYLTADSALAAAAAPVVANPASACDEALSRAAARARGRDVTACWPLATARSGAEVFLVQFTTIGADALAALVLADSARLRFADFPARYRGAGQDLWRVDDQGKFSPDGFAILFLARRSGADVLGVTWMGTEGENAFLLAADSADALRFVTKSYRYLSPD